MHGATLIVQFLRFSREAYFRSRMVLRLLTSPHEQYQLLS